MASEAMQQTLGIEYGMMTGRTLRIGRYASGVTVLGFDRPMEAVPHLSKLRRRTVSLCDARLALSLSLSLSLPPAACCA